MTTPVLETRGLSKSFGALRVARDIELTLEKGARRALIGPNGAGKTTLVNLITGALKPSAGQVLLDGEDITNLSQAKRAQCGIARTFQINQLFRGLTVLDNIYLAIGERTGACDRLWRPAGAERAVIDEAIELDVVFRFAQRITVLVSGAVLTEGAPEEIAADERVRSVYLGEDHRRQARHG